MRAPLAPRRFRFWCAVWACVPGPDLGCAPPFLAGLSGCVFCAFFFFFALLCRLVGVPVPGLVDPVAPSPFFRAGLLALFFFVVCVCMFRSPFSRWVAVPGLVLPVLAGWSPRASLGGGFGRLLWCWRAVWWLWAVFAPPPLSPLCCFFFFFFWGGGGCLFLPLPSMGWRTHWSNFSVVFRAAVGGCVLFGRVLARWVVLAMYKLGSAPLRAGLGPGSAGWAAAPGGCVWLWVRGLGLFVSFPLCGAGFNLLGSQPPLLSGVRSPRVLPAVPVCGVLVRRLLGCAVACFG